MPDAGDAAPFLAQVLAAGRRHARARSPISAAASGTTIRASRANRTSTARGIPAPESGGFASFARRYQAAFGSAPCRTATLAYDATSLAAGLASRFGDQRFSAQTLTNPNGFIGIDGAFRFLQNGLNQRGLAVYEIKGGQAVMVDPAPKSFARAPGT